MLTALSSSESWTPCCAVKYGGVWCFTVHVLTLRWKGFKGLRVMNGRGLRRGRLSCRWISFYRVWTVQSRLINMINMRCSQYSPEGHRGMSVWCVDTGFQKSHISAVGFCLFKGCHPFKLLSWSKFCFKWYKKIYPDTHTVQSQANVWCLHFYNLNRNMHEKILPKDTVRCPFWDCFREVLIELYGQVGGCSVWCC